MEIYSKVGVKKINNIAQTRTVTLRNDTGTVKMILSGNKDRDPLARMDSILKNFEVSIVLKEEPTVQKRITDDFKPKS